MKNKIIIVLILIIVALLVFLLRPTAPPEEVPVARIFDDQSAELIEFKQEDAEKILNNLDVVITGYGPGKSHDGKFDVYSVSNISFNSDGLISSADVSIDAKSRNFGISGLDDHLCKSDFLDCDIYPNIEFYLSSVTKESNSDYVISGDLKMRGVTKTVSFPVKRTATGFETDVRVDVRQFGITNKAINDEVRIRLSSK